jgi:hypothetical protein
MLPVVKSIYRVAFFLKVQFLHCHGTVVGIPCLFVPSIGLDVSDC